jgi:hypothetical protein
MRDDQFIRLQQLEEKLTEQFLSEADPVNWSADGILPKNMTQAERGDRYWCKKNAVATIGLTIRIGSLIGMVQRREPAPPDADGDDSRESDLDRDIAAAEAEAKKFLAKMERKSRAKTPD